MGMKKYHLHTTLSLKHKDMLDRLKGKYDTQQKVLELALESLESGSKKNDQLSREDKFLLYVFKESGWVCSVPKDALKLLVETVDLDRLREYVDRSKPLEYTMEFYAQKPLKECRLNDILDAAVESSRMSNWFDTIGYTDDGDHYTLKIYHSMGFNTTKIYQIFFESLFNSYGVKCESMISESTLFMTVHKSR